MPASAAQTQFAAEFALFLVALAGLALVALRAELLTASRWGRAALAMGFAGLTVTAFLHGSLLVPSLTSPEIVALRAAGMDGEAALAAGSWAARDWLGVPGLVHGAPADLLVVDHDPRRDPKVLRSPSLLLLRGVAVR